MHKNRNWAYILRQKCVLFLDDPADTVMCPTFPFSPGNNIVRWICEDKELTNKNDPYYYKQAVGTVCNPTHE